MKVDGPKDNGGAIPPVDPVPDTAKPGDHRKSPEERVLDARGFQDRATFSAKLSAEDEINLSGISREDAARLADHKAFKGWLPAYTGEMPGPLVQLQQALGNAAADTLTASDRTYLEIAGTLIANAQQVVESRPQFSGSDTHALADLKDQAREIGVKLQGDRGLSK